MNAEKHILIGEMTDNSYRASSSPVLTGMIEHVQVERFQTTQDERIQDVPQRRQKRTNAAVMGCCLRSHWDVRGYRKRTFYLWRRKGRFEISEQRQSGSDKSCKRKSVVDDCRDWGNEKRKQQIPITSREISVGNRIPISRFRMEKTDGEQLNRNDEEVNYTEEELEMKRIGQIMA